MMNLIKVVKILFVLIALSGCEKLIHKAGAEYLKLHLIDICGEDDPACVKAVEEQFPACQEKYDDDWDRYLNSGSSKDDELLRIYSENMYSCIVDPNGNPYFFYEAQ